MSHAFVGLGSNLHNPIEQVGRALAALRGGVAGTLLASSSLYRSPPLGPPDQPDFINAVVWLDTAVSPLDLLDVLQAIEHAQHRLRLQRWGPRTLDLDLLSVDDATYVDDRLTLPHPGIAERAFVLVPWSEIAPEYRIPGLGRVVDLATRVTVMPLQRLDVETARHG